MGGAGSGGSLSWFHGAHLLLTPVGVDTAALVRGKPRAKLGLPSSTQSDGCRGKRDGASSLESKLKRRLEREGLSSERWDRITKMRAPKKKRIKLSHPKDTDSLKLERECSYELAPSADTQSLPSDSSSSEQEDSEDEDAICPAVSCLQPEGDEVSEVWAMEDVRSLNSEPCERQLARPGLSPAYLP